MLFFLGKNDSKSVRRVDILFPYRSPSPRPHPDPTQHPETDPKRSRKGAEKEPNGAKRSRNGAKRSRNGPKFSFSGWDGRGVCRGRGGGGVVREKENHYLGVAKHYDFHRDSVLVRKSPLGGRQKRAMLES